MWRRRRRTAEFGGTEADSDEWEREAYPNGEGCFEFFMCCKSDRLALLLGMSALA